ncbi:MAG: riboflavin biosynthesis protein RibF [Planctomycetota bacterium]
MPPRSVLTIGNFDGVHLGHQAILAECRRRATEHGPETRVVAITFDPPPAAVLRPGSEPPQIDEPSLSLRIDRLKRAGADHTEAWKVDHAFLEQSADEFIENIVKVFAPMTIVEGPDFRFGKRRAGDHARLQQLGVRYDFEAVRVPRQTTTLANRQLVPISSSLIRWLIGRGRVHDAATCLGRPFELAGTVIQGEQRGRTIGVPTANLDPTAFRGRILPADGVYAARAICDGHDFHAAVSVGTKPTFHNEHQTTVEAHLLGFNGDLYGKPLELHFVRWVRDQYAFPGLESLVSQLHRDIQRTESILAHAS